jgi:oligoendopeptidase F
LFVYDLTKEEEIQEELKAANDAETVTKLMKKMNKFGSDISTDITVIQIRYSIDTTNEEYRSANDQLSEIYLIFHHSLFQ